VLEAVCAFWLELIALLESVIILTTRWSYRNDENEGESSSIGERSANAKT
jgi:hypothetical protein